MKKKEIVRNDKKIQLLASFLPVVGFFVADPIVTANLYVWTLQRVIKVVVKNSKWFVRAF